MEDVRTAVSLALLLPSPVTASLHLSDATPLAFPAGLRAALVASGLFGRAGGGGAGASASAAHAPPVGAHALTGAVRPTSRRRAAAAAREKFVAWGADSGGAAAGEDGEEMD